MKLVVLLLLVAVIVSLFSGLFFLAKDKDQPNSPRLLNALKMRVVLSIALVLFLVVSYQVGWIAP
ncbi:MAG TPA: twin transmembrane helix small protein [Woeseiaceae bacterium]|nr:twin transmembrane helix small protein [Woeseiaceae bacterium]